MSFAPLCNWPEHRVFSGVLGSLNQDILRYLNKSPENIAAGDNFKSRLGAILTTQILSLALYRLAHYLRVNRWRITAYLFTYLNAILHKTYIAPESCIGPGCFLPHPVGVTFMGKAGCGLTMYSQATCCANNKGLGNPELWPALGSRVSLGGHSVVMGPVHVGDDTKVSFNVLLVKDAPENVLVLARRPKSAQTGEPAEAAGWMATT